jgi:hypothetical protein
MCHSFAAWPAFQIVIAAFASHRDCFAACASIAALSAYHVPDCCLCNIPDWATPLLHLQRPRPPNHSCCICNIIVRRVGFGVQAATSKYINNVKEQTPYLLSLCYRQCGQVWGKYDPYTVPPVLQYFTHSKYTR